MVHPPDEQTPAVSVLMSVHNGERYMQQSIRSILRQTFDDFEFVVVNDGSTDGSLEMLQRFVNEDARIRVLDQENTGLPTALNNGIAKCRGKYLARIDHDDFSMPDRLERQAAFLDEHPDVVAVGCWARMIDSDGRYLTTLKPPSDNQTIQRQALAGHTTMFHPAMMIRGDAVRKVGGYDERFTCTQDLDLLLRLGEVGELANMEAALIAYRLHAGGASEQKRAYQRDMGRLACELAWKRRGIEGRFEATDVWRPGEDSASRLKYMLQYGW